MTFMLILGAAAGLYLIWLLFRLAALALPLGTGIALAFELQDRGYGIGAALAMAFLAGILLHLAGRHLYAHGGSTLLRACVAMLFLLPAGVAGYYGMTGIVRLFATEGMLVAILPMLAAVVAAVAAVRGLNGSSVDAIGVGDRERDDRAPAIPASASPASDRL